MQLLVRMNLRHKPEVLREVFSAETMQTAIHHDAKFESHSFWHRQSVKLLQQQCCVIMSTDAVNQLRCRVENGLQLPKLAGRKSSEDSIAVVQPH